MQSSSFFK